MNGFELTEYDKILINAIPYLDSYSNVSGAEGTAYFLSDKLIIKKFNNQEDEQMVAECFDDYCKEIQKYGIETEVAPKIYSWLKVPNEEKPTQNDYYILEERVQGRELFFCYIDDIYSLCTNFCSKMEFDNVVGSPKNNPKLYWKIMLRYFDDFVDMNKYLCEVDESQLTNFIAQTYLMYMDGEFSRPDIYPSNVIFNSSRLNIIDNHVMPKDKVSSNESSLENGFVNDIINLFIFNEQITHKLNKLIKKSQNEKIQKALLNLKSKNSMLCKFALIRMIEIMNKTCDNPSLTLKSTYDRLCYSLLQIMSARDVQDVMNNINIQLQ